MAKPTFGQIAVFSGSVRALAGQESRLTIEIQAGFFPMFRFTNLFLNPPFEEASNLIFVTSWTFQFLDETTPREVILSDPVNIKQIANDALLANGALLYDAEVAMEQKSRMTLNLRNDDENEQAVDVTFALLAKFVADPVGFDRRQGSD